MLVVPWSFAHQSLLCFLSSFQDPYGGRGTAYLHSPSEHENAPSGNPTGAVVVPISVATTFRQFSPGQPTAVDDLNSFGAGYEYSRTGNPTRGAFERAMISAEKGSRFAVAFASGSAATAAVVHCLQSGDHILCIDDVYGGTQRYFRRIVRPNMGIEIDFCDMSTVVALPFKPNTKLVWVESPTNPTLKVSDIVAIAQTCKEKKCWLAVDNTFCSPYFQSPLELGADLAVHSVTKYIGGHRYVASTLPTSILSFTSHQEPTLRIREVTWSWEWFAPTTKSCTSSSGSFKTESVPYRLRSTASWRIEDSRHCI
jgi:cystathionine beta-lyase/cystathionine gamma-synthase